MKKKSFLHSLLMMALVMISLTGCVKEDSIIVSSQDLRFGLDAESQTFVVKANCKWMIFKNDDADWYTISPMSGKAKDSIVTVTVNDYNNGDFRGAWFTVSSRGGHIRRSILVSQNKLDFYGMVNKVYGVFSLEQWKTDYYGQIIDDEYDYWEYNPYDTTQGHLMYFLEDGVGYQRNRALYDHAIWFPFDYEFDADSSILHIVFHLANDSIEPYDPEVLCASDSLYRIYHEYKPHWFERADMRKIGTITSGEKAFLQQKFAKRKKGQPIFMNK